MAAREMVQNPFHRAIQYRLDQLQEMGISTGKSTFSLVMRQLVAEGKDHLLKSVITSDLHSDTFEDQKLQESLLPFYYEQRDMTAFNRTLAILTARVLEEDPEMLEMKRWNLILRSNVARQDLYGVKGVLEKLQDQQIQIEPESTADMSERMLSPRQVGRGPTNTKELDLLIRIWQDALRSGANVPPKVWKEILRRLGMSGRLVAFERLALWLASWYSSPAHRKSQSSMLSRTDRGSNLLLSATNTEIKPSSPMHPSHLIFSPSMQQGIVAWGFQHHHTNHERRFKYKQRLNWTWGLTLLRRLRDCNVHVAQQVVSKAFKLRLIGLFGGGWSRRKINRINRHRNQASVEQYIRKGKEIWGPDLLQRYQSLLVQQDMKRISIARRRKESRQ